MCRVLSLISFVVLISTIHGASQRCGGPAGRSCLVGMSSCVDGACKCDSPYSWGNPNFACYKKDDIAAEIKNDPVLMTFGKESVQFPFPCRYLVTHVKQELKDANDHITGHCEFMIHGYNAKYRGKFYTLGFDVAAKIAYDDGREVKASIRVYGLAKRGRYQFRMRGTKGEFLPDGPWKRDKVDYHDKANDIRLSLKAFPKNNQMVYEMKKCGLRLTFVPYDVTVRRNQTSVPGISVTVKNAYHWHSEPQWLSDETVMALAPLIAGGRHLADIRRRGLGVEQSILYRAFTAGVEQNQPYDDRGQCALAGTTLRTCSRSKRIRAVKHCDWILEEPKFIFCYDRTTGAKKILHLFNYCLEVHCKGRPCEDVTREILQRECENYGNSAAAFVKSRRCRRF